MFSTQLIHKFCMADSTNSKSAWLHVIVTLIFSVFHIVRFLETTAEADLGLLQHPRWSSL